MSKLSMTDDEIRTRYKAGAITAWNTRPPRFTEVEREAMEVIAKLAYNYVKGFDNVMVLLERGNRDLGYKKLCSIATVRAMLTEADKGKGYGK